MMELSLRFRYWSVLQVVAIIVCIQGKVLSAGRAQGCVGSQLNLSCTEMKVIQIKAIVLGHSSCSGTSCCIKNINCTSPNANANHTTDVHRRCHNKQNCTVGVLREKISCGVQGAWSNNDFERITYNCKNDPHKSSATASSTDGQSTKSFKQTTTDHIENESPEYQSGNSWVLPVVMTIVCLLILIAIVFVVFIMRRKRGLKGIAAVEIVTENDTNLRNEIIIDGNENETMSLSNVSGSPVYSNSMIKQSNNKDTTVYENYEVPNNCVADNAGSTSKNNQIISCDVDSREPAYQVPRPRDDVYSVLRDVKEPERAGSTAGASIVDSSVYCNVEIREPAKAANTSALSAHNEASNLKENECEAVRADKAIIHPDPTKKETNSPAHKTATVNETSRNPLTSEPSDKVASKDKDGTKVGYPNPIYEVMSPLTPESTYANAPVLSVSSRAIPMEANVTENPYCEMKSPPVRSKDNGK